MRRIFFGDIWIVVVVIRQTSADAHFTYSSIG